MIFGASQWLLSQSDCKEYFEEKYKKIYKSIDTNRALAKELLTLNLKNDSACFGRLSKNDQNHYKFIFYLYSSNLYRTVGDKTQAVYFGDKAIKQALLANDSNDIASAYNNLGLLYKIKFELDSSLKYYKEALRLKKRLNDSIPCSIAHLNIAEIYLERGDEDSCYQNIVDSKKYIDSNIYPLRHASIVRFEGYYHYENQSYYQSIKKYIYAYEIFKNNHVEARAFQTALSISNIFFEIELLDEALIWLNKESKSINVNEYPIEYGFLQLELAKIYIKKEKDSVSIYLNKSETVFNTLGLESAIAQLMLVKGDLAKSQKEYNEAISSYDKAYQFYSNLNDDESICYVSYKLGEVYFLLNKYDTALKRLHEAENCNVDDYKMASEVYYLLGSIYDNKQDLKKSKNYFMESLKMKDSLISNKETNRIIQVVNFYKDKLQEKEKKQLELIIENNKRQKLNLILSISIIVITLSLIIYILFQKSKVRKRELILKDAEIKNQILEKEIITSKLKTYTDKIIEKNGLINKLNLELNELDRKSFSEGLIENISNESNWAKFMIEFELLYNNFFTQIKEDNPEITQTDLRFLALIKLNLSDKEIADVLNISYDAARKGKSRLKKKINIQTNLNSYLDSF